MFPQNLLDFLNPQPQAQPMGFQLPQTQDGAMQADPSQLQAILASLSGQQKQPDTVQNILMSRFRPQEATAEDAGNAALAGIAGNTYVDPGTYADQRTGQAMKQLTALGEYQKNIAMGQLYANGGQGSQTLKIAQGLMAENPSLTLADAVALAKSSGTVPLTINGGQITNLPGSVSAAQNMEHGKQTGQNTSDLTYKPLIGGAVVTAESNAKSDTAATSTLPIIDQIRGYNDKTFSMPYADNPLVRGYSRVAGDVNQQSKQQNMDLLKQGRTDLAAPLAKELGVNPTDRDFQATLDRIFDSDASQASRAAQIDALEQRILARRNARNGGGLNPPQGGAVTLTPMKTAPRVIHFNDLPE